MPDASPTADAKPGAGGPLAGIKVLDLSKLLPGPWCTQMLGDFGADVIKIEQPVVGDPARHNPPVFTGESTYFATVNNNKRSIALDLTRPEDREIAHRLIAGADIMVESFRRGVPERLQIDYETARKINPAIIFCSITGFGQTGPFAGIPGHDLVVQSVTGIMGAADNGLGVAPVPSFQTGDYLAATYAVIAVLAALRQRDATGAGAYLDISMFDSMFSMSNIVGGSALARAAGHRGDNRMEVFGHNPRYSTYPTKDGKAVAVSLLEKGIWAEFCTLIERPDLVAEDEGPQHRHTLHGDRAEIYRAVIGEICLSRPRDELVDWLVSHNVPITPIYSPEEALASPHVRARGLVEWIDHPTEGRVPLYANPLRNSGLNLQPRTPSPALDGDRASILAEISGSQPV
jgi:crotonobetainyl-CoA:carnitine CoA-transferase CaiB-like acyl-CoA transferase